MAKRNDIQVKLTGVHLCCLGCVNAVDAAIRSVEGADSHCDMENGTVTLTARDDSVAQRALDALADAGFYGSSDNKQLAIRDMSNVPRCRVQSLKVSGIHNCCGPCSDAIKGAIATVDGVTEETVKPRATTFEVIGDFVAYALVKALNAAGFSARVEQRKTAHLESLNLQKES
jgi:copper chaperone CopZ